MPSPETSSSSLLLSIETNIIYLLNTFEVHDGFEIISYIVKQLVEVNALPIETYVFCCILVLVFSRGFVHYKSMLMKHACFVTFALWIISFDLAHLFVLVHLSLSFSLSLSNSIFLSGSLCPWLYFTINFDIWKMQMAELTQIAYELGIKHQQIAWIMSECTTNSLENCLA